MINKGEEGVKEDELGGRKRRKTGRQRGVGISKVGIDHEERRKGAGMRGE